MARATTHTAKYDIYKTGAQVPDKTTKSGMRRNRSKPFDSNDTIFCPKGEVYYTWAFRFGGKHESRTNPKPSQLTQSSFMSPYLEIQERISEVVLDDSILDFIDEIISDCENLRDEQQDKLGNMPEGLQQGDTGQLIQERVDSLETTINELEECKETEIPQELDDDDIQDIEGEVDAGLSEDEQQEVIETEKEERLNLKQTEAIDEIYEALNNVSFDAN